MVAVFVVLAGLAGIWSGIKSQIVYNSIVDSFPPQFQDPLASRYAFSVLALSHTTPLSLQAEYVSSQIGGCVVFLCISLAFFSIHQLIIGCLILIALFAQVWSTIKSRKTYKENCDRAQARGNKEVL
jgi:TRAP-type C4-dicarboxylate transport system permease small subunit